VTRDIGVKWQAIIQRSSNAMDSKYVNTSCVTISSRNLWILFVEQMFHSIHDYLVGCFLMMYRYRARALKASLIFLAHATPRTP